MSNRKRHSSTDKAGAKGAKMAQVQTPSRTSNPSPQKPLNLATIQDSINLRPETISKLDSNLWTWLHRAAYQGQLDIVEYLLEMNLQYAETLASAVAPQQSSSSSQLPGGSPSPSLSIHASRVVAVNQQDVFGRTALHVACSYSTPECVNAILGYNAKMVKWLNQELPKASPELKLLLVLNLDLTNTKGQTAAMCSVRRSDFPTLQLVLQAGADPNIQDDHQLSCLQMVCLRRCSASVQAQADAEKAPSTSSPHTRSGSTSTASGSPHNTQLGQLKQTLIVDSPEFTRQLAETAKYLISKGADLGLQDLYHETSLHYACRRADTELLQTLLHNGKLHQSESLLVALRLLYQDGKLPSAIAQRLECVDLLNSAYLALMHREVELKGIAKMTTIEVCEWLVSIGLANSRDLFLKNQVTGAFLQQVSDETIKRDLGMESLGQRTTFINRLEELKGIDKRRKSRSKNTLGGPFSSAAMGGFDGSDANGEPGLGDEDAALLGLPNARDYEIQFNDLNVGDVIGRGNFGEVRKGQWKDVHVAIKTIYRTGGDTAKQDVYREMGILAQLRHPNILGFLGFVKHAGSVMMITDLMTGGSLHTFIKNSYETVTRLRFKLVAGIVRGMVYLHHRKLVHRDLNTKNLLLDDHYGIKISDFGLSRPKHDHKMTMSVGFLGGMAPEVYRGNDYTEKADVFSFAMVVYEIVTGKESHHDQSNVMMYAHNMSTNGYRPPLDDKITPPDWNNLIRKCWATDPQERPSFNQLLDELHAMEQAGAKAMESPSVPISLTESGAYIT